MSTEQDVARDRLLSADSIRLRTIAAAVVSGDCPRDEYRLERRRLIDLHAGEQTPDLPLPVADSDTRPVPVVRASAAVEPATPVAGQDAPPSPPQAAGRDLVIGVVAFVAVLAVLWGLLAWLW